MESKPVEFSYRPGVRRLLWVTMFFGLVALFSEFMALTVDHGFYWRGIDVDLNEATMIYSVLVAACATLGVLTFLKLNWSLSGGSKIGLTENELLVSGFFGARKIAFNAIREVQMGSARQSRFLRIRTASGKLDINERWLPEGAFDRIRKFVEQRSNMALRHV